MMQHGRGKVMVCSSSHRRNGNHFVDVVSIACESTHVHANSEGMEAAAATLHMYDVICGRHKDAFNNIGNRRFRYTIALALKRYSKAENRRSKSIVIDEIIDLVHSNGGRFLQRDNNKDNTNNSTIVHKRDAVWTELSRKEAHKKVGHAFRDMALSNNTKSDGNSFHTSKRLLDASGAVPNKTNPKKPYSAARISSRSLIPSDDKRPIHRQDHHNSHAAKPDAPTLAKTPSFDQVVQNILEPIRGPILVRNELLLDDKSFASIYQAELE